MKRDGQAELPLVLDKIIDGSPTDEGVPMIVVAGKKRMWGVIKKVERDEYYT